MFPAQIKARGLFSGSSSSRAINSGSGICSASSGSGSASNSSASRTSMMQVFSSKSSFEIRSTIIAFSFLVLMSRVMFLQCVQEVSFGTFKALIRIVFKSMDRNWCSFMSSSLSNVRCACSVPIIPADVPRIPASLQFFASVGNSGKRQR